MHVSIQNYHEHILIHTLVVDLSTTVGGLVYARDNSEWSHASKMHQKFYNHFYLFLISG